MVEYATDASVVVSGFVGVRELVSMPRPESSAGVVADNRLKYPASSGPPTPLLCLLVAPHLAVRLRREAAPEVVESGSAVEPAIPAGRRSAASAAEGMHET